MEVKYFIEDLSDDELIGRLATAYREFADSKTKTEEDSALKNFVALKSEVLKRMSMPKGSVKGELKAFYKTRKEADEAIRLMNRFGWNVTMNEYTAHGAKVFVVYEYVSY